MGDILVHHGILGQKWGVRRFQNTDGSLTKAGKDRYGVGDGRTSNADTRTVVDQRDKYIEAYNKVLDGLRSGYKDFMPRDKYGKLDHDHFKEIYLRLDMIKAYTVGSIEEDTSFKEHAKTVGIDIPNNERSAIVLMDLLKDLRDMQYNNASFDAAKYDKLINTALKYIAVDASEKMMPNSIGITDRDVEMQKKIEEAYELLDEYGLFGLINVSTYMYDGTNYAFYEYIYPDSEFDTNGNPTHSKLFMLNDIDGVRKFALENELHFKDFRASSNAKSREKNIDTSGGAKKVTKREKLEISDKERSEKESSSKASREAQAKMNKEMLDSVINAKKRTQAAIKQTEAVKEAEARKAEERLKKEEQRLEESFKKQEKISNSTSKKIQDVFQSGITKTQMSLINSNKFFEDIYTKVWKDIWGSTIVKKKKFEHSDRSTRDILIHHGILNQKWGVRNGPPYPLGGGDYSPSEKKAIKGQRRSGNSIYNKKHFDEVLKADKTTLSTLSYDKDRTKNTDMFYATHDIWDKHQYNALFNAKVPKTLYDESGNPIGTGTCLKFRIDNSLKSDIKVASEDSAAKIFKDLYKKDRDFYNFVTDPNRMENYFVKEKYKFKGYQEVKTVLNKMRSSKYNPTEKDISTLYRMFNYVIPYDGQGNARKGNDVTTQRTKFFKELKDAGYGAVLDTNDAIYGGFKAKSPVIVFDMEQIIPKDVYQTTMNDKRVSSAALVMRKLLGI